MQNVNFTFVFLYILYICINFLYSLYLIFVYNIIYICVIIDIML